MMRFPSKETVERVRRVFPPGTKVELLEMADGQAPPVGTIGTVLAVDDCADLVMAWSNGSGLNVIFGVDRVRKVGDPDA